MKIIVSQDLSVAFVCNGKTYFTSPYREVGMEFLLKRSPEEYYSTPKILNDKTTFLDDYLYLYAENKIEPSLIESIDIARVNADVFILKYNIETNKFEVDMLYGECCDAANYIFS